MRRRLRLQVTMSSSKIWLDPSSPSTEKLAEAMVTTGILIRAVTVSCACSPERPASSGLYDLKGRGIKFAFASFV